MISEFNKIEGLFKEIDKSLTKRVSIFLIGGAVLLHQGLKAATKDIDLIVETKEEFLELQKVLKELRFVAKIPGNVYKHMNLSQIFERDDFRIDVFQKEVCGRFSFSKNMVRRAKTLLNLKNVELALSSNEDIFLFKTMTEREGDLEDCISLAQTGIEWNEILSELKHQIQESGQNVWITWVGERLDLLEDKGLVIPIMNQINVLREEFFSKLEKKFK